MSQPFIPAAVRAAGEKADQLAAELNKPAEEPVVVSQAVEAPAVVPFVDGEVQTTAPEGSADFWKHKFDATNGRYKSELARNVSLQEEMKADKAEVIRLKGMIEGLQSGKREEQEDDDLSDFPDELVKGVNQRIDQATAGLKEEISGLKSQAEASTQATTARFYGELDGAAPNWEALNTDPAFLAWLQSNAKAGSTTNCATELGRAFSQQNAAAVARIFNLYPKAGNSPAHLVVPGKGPAGQPPTQNNMSRADIAKFYTDVTKGLYGPPGVERNAKVSAFEQRINAAQLAGLLTP